MTREEEIRQAVEENISRGLESEENYAATCRGFISGAEWADAHPLFGWHDIKETPPSGLYFVHELWGTHPFVIVAEYRAEDDEWRPWEDVQVVGLPLDDDQRSRITHWMPIPIYQTKIMTE